MRDQDNPSSRHTQNPSCDDGRLPLVEGVGEEPATEEPEDLPHSNRNERVDSEGGAL
jgi:hypothetical protein